MTTRDTLTLPEVATRVGLSADEVLTHVSAGKLPSPQTVSGDDDPRWSRVDITQKLLPQVKAKHPKVSRKWLVDGIYREVIAFHNRNGHAAIHRQELGEPTPSGEPFELGRAVTALRAAHHAGMLTPAESARFEKLTDWTWDSRAARWLSTWHQAVSHPEEFKLRRWMLLQFSNIDQLPSYGVEKLRSRPDLGPNDNPSRVPVFVDAVRRWLETRGPNATVADLHFRATVSVPGQPKPVPIGRIAVYYRRRYRGLEGVAGSPLPPDEVAAIEALPGWEWEAKKTGSNSTMAVLSAKRVAAVLRQWVTENPTLSLNDLAFTQLGWIVDEDGERHKVRLGARVHAYQNRGKAGALLQPVRDVLEAVPGWQWDASRSGESRTTSEPEANVPS